MKRTIIFAAALAAGCGTGGADDSAQAGAQAGSPGTARTGGGDVSVTMEGSTLTIPAVDWRASTVENVDGERRYMLTGQDTALQVNLNIKDGAIPTTFPATFTLPADNSPRIKIDLNFFNQDRDSRRMQKRIIFSQGTIEVRALDENTFDISFDGSGHPLMANDEMFPITGTVRTSR